MHERIRAVNQLLTLTPPERLSKHIRVLLLTYLQYKANDLPDDFPIMVEDVNNLFEILDKLKEGERFV